MGQKEKQDKIADIRRIFCLQKGWMETKEEMYLATWRERAQGAIFGILKKHSRHVQGTLQWPEVAISRVHCQLGI